MILSPTLKQLTLGVALLGALAASAPAFADDWRDRDRDRDRHEHRHHYPPPRPHVYYEPGYVYTPPPVYYQPPPPPPVAPSFNVVIPLRFH